MNNYELQQMIQDHRNQLNMQNQELMVTKDNDLIKSSYKLTTNENKLLLICMGYINSHNSMPTNKKFTITAKEFAEKCNINIDAAYKTLDEIGSKLYERDVKTYDGKCRERFRWVTSIKYHDNEAKIELRFSPEAETYLTNQSKNYTQYHWKQISNLKSIYAIRIYEWLMSWKDKGKLFITIEELKKRLEIENEYKLFQNLKVNVINKAINELNKKSDIKIEWKPIKKGKTIHAIEFNFVEKTQKDIKKISYKTKNIKNNYTQTHPSIKEYKGLAPTAPEPSPLAKEYIEKNQIKLPLNKITGI